jgi:hypothetical protein
MYSGEYDACDVTQGRIHDFEWVMPNNSAPVGGFPGGKLPPGKFWNLEPRKCDFLRSERTFYINFDFEIVIEIAKFSAKCVENLDEILQKKS